MSDTTNHLKEALDGAEKLAGPVGQAARVVEAVGDAHLLSWPTGEGARAGETLAIPGFPPPALGTTPWQEAQQHVGRFSGLLGQASLVAMVSGFAGKLFHGAAERLNDVGILHTIGDVVGAPQKFVETTTFGELGDRAMGVVHGVADKFGSVDSIQHRITAEVKKSLETAYAPDPPGGKALQHTLADGAVKAAHRAAGDISTMTVGEGINQGIKVANIAGTILSVGHDMTSQYKAACRLQAAATGARPEDVGLIDLCGRESVVRNVAALTLARNVPLLAQACAQGKIHEIFGDKAYLASIGLMAVGSAAQQFGHDSALRSYEGLIRVEGQGALATALKAEELGPLVSRLAPKGAAKEELKAATAYSVVALRKGELTVDQLVGQLHQPEGFARAVAQGRAEIEAYRAAQDAALQASLAAQQAQMAAVQVPAR